MINFFIKKQLVFQKNVTKRFRKDDFDRVAETEIDLNEQKDNKLKDDKLKLALKDTILALILIGLSLTVAYQLVDRKTYEYQLNLKNIFGAGSISTSFLDVRKNNGLIITIIELSFFYY